MCQLAFFASFEYPCSNGLWPLEYIDSFRAGTVFIRQNLPFTDVRYCRIKTVPALKWLRMTVFICRMWATSIGLYNILCIVLNKKCFLFWLLTKKRYKTVRNIFVKWLIIVTTLTGMYTMAIRNKSWLVNTRRLWAYIGISSQFKIIKFI